MLTSIPPRALHWVRDRAREVQGLAELGLALLCPCDDDHGAAARWLHDETAGAGMAETCYRPGCTGPVTGASDYCTPECEQLARPHRFAAGITCWCTARHWRGEPVRVQRLAAGMERPAVRGFQ